MKKFILTIEKFFTNKSNIDRITKKAHEQRVYFSGKIILLMPEHIYSGITVLTNEGIGVINGEYNDSISGRTIRIDLKRGYAITRKIKEIYQYAVYNRLLDKFIPLSAKCYNYIIDNNQLIYYRITKRGYAMLHKEYMKNCEYINIFNSKRGGRSMLLHLKHEGYKITK